MEKPAGEEFITSLTYLLQRNNTELSLSSNTKIAGGDENAGPSLATDPNNNDQIANKEQKTLTDVFFHLLKKSLGVIAHEPEDPLITTVS